MVLKCFPRYTEELHGHSSEERTWEDGQEDTKVGPSPGELRLSC